MEETIGLYQFQQDLRQPKKVWSYQLESPSFLCLFQNSLFAITESETCAKVYSFTVDRGGYQYKNQMPVKGAQLCFLTYSPKNQALLGSCYFNGGVFSVRIKDGILGDLLSYHTQVADRPNQLTRAHSIVLQPDERFAYAVNIALNRIYVYRLQDGKLIPNDGFPYLQLPLGKGPRHMRFSHGRAYVITEYSSEIIVLEHDADTGRLRVLSHHSTLPDGFHGISNCSTLCISNDGRFLYGANRGADTVAQFAIDNQGNLTKLADHSCLGHHPRHMELAKGSSCLMVANQYSNEVVLMQLDAESGEPTGSNQRIPFSAPAYLCDCSEEA